MADNSITFDVTLSDKQAQTELAKLQRKIADLKKALEEAQTQKPILEENLNKAEMSLERAVQKLKEMRQAEKGAFSSVQIQDQAKYVTELKREYEAALDAVEKNDKLLANGPENLQQMETAASGLVKQLNASNSAGAKFNEKIKGAKKDVDSIFKRIGGLVRRVLLFSVIAKGLNEFRNWISEVVKVTPGATEAIGRLKGALLTMAQPIVEVIVPAIVKLINILTVAIAKLAQFFSALSGKSLAQTQANAKALYGETKALNSTGSAAKKASKQLASFDELNILTDNSTDASGGSGGIAPVFDANVEAIENLDEILKLVRLIGEALLAWKISSALGLGLQGFLGILGIIDGAIRGIKAWLDILNNGANWKNIEQLAIAILEIGAGISILTGSHVPLLVSAIVGVILLFTQLGGTADQTIQGITDIFKGFVQFVKGVFSGDLKSAFDGLKTMFKGVINTILGVFGGFVNSVVKGINWLIDKINTISFAVPEWVPGIGGKSVGFHLQHVKEWNVPKLATGAVIPPNREFLAMLGDNKQETEVVSPLSTMKQALLDAIRESGFSNKPVNIYLDGKVLATTTTRYQTQFARALR